MDDEIHENNSEVYNHYLELSKPTKEDLERVFTDEELKELCLKHKCRVNMWRWNVANEYRIVFSESGRYQRWSERDRLRMLAKAVNKHKPAVLYKEEEIRKIRKEEWAFQLKENILSLNHWRRKELRSQSPRLVVSDSEDVEQEVLSQIDVNTESMNVNELLTQNQFPAGENESNEEFDQEVETEIEVHTESMNGGELLTQTQDPKLSKANVTQRRKIIEVAHPTESSFNNSLLLTQTQGLELSPQKTTSNNSQTQVTQQQSVIRENNLTQKDPEEEVQSQLEVNTESMNVSELLTQTQQPQELPAPPPQPLEEIPARVPTPASSNNSDNVNTLFTDFVEDLIDEDDGDSEDSIETVLHNTSERQQLQVVKVAAIGETLQSQEVAPEIENLYDVNTMSMSIDSEMSTQTQDLIPIQQSQDVIPASYDNFKNIIPLTSTQSQGLEVSE